MCGGALCCAGATVCCAGKMFCNAMCLPCKKMGVQGRNFSKIGYVVFQIFWILVCIALLYTARDLVDLLPDKL